MMVYPIAKRPPVQGRCGFATSRWTVIATVSVSGRPKTGLWIYRVDGPKAATGGTSADSP